MLREPHSQCSFHWPQAIAYLAMRIISARVVLAGLFAAAAVLPLSACGSDSEGTIRIYTGRHYDLETAFEAFSNEFNIDIEFLE